MSPLDAGAVRAGLATLKADRRSPDRPALAHGYTVDLEFGGWDGPGYVVRHHGAWVVGPFRSRVLAVAEVRALGGHLAV